MTPPEITPEEQTAYLAAQAVICPRCGSHNIEEIGISGDCDKLEKCQSVICHACGLRWTDFYTLSHIAVEELDEDEEYDAHRTEEPAAPPELMCPQCGGTDIIVNDSIGVAFCQGKGCGYSGDPVGFEPPPED